MNLPRNIRKGNANKIQPKTKRRMNDFIRLLQGLYQTSCLLKLFSRRISSFFYSSSFLRVAIRPIAPSAATAAAIRAAELVSSPVDGS